MLFTEIKAYIDSLDIHEIAEDRQTMLIELRNYVRDIIAQNKPVNLIFICTHNSRRSVLGQVWAQVAAARYGISPVLTFSGGTEITACNPRTIAALSRAGLEVNQTTEGENPVYELSYDAECPPITAFSKVYDQSPNPTNGFAALMTCSHADDNCPFIPGAEKRFAVTYTDPKEADDTPAESRTYDERCRQIATEMMYVFSKV